MRPQPTAQIVSRAPRSGAAKLAESLKGVAEVRAPEDAEEPILAPVVRQAVHGWLVEMNNAGPLKEVGCKPVTTALLYGPPGCGKTTLAHHLGARLGIPMVLVGSEGIFAPYLGQAEKNVAKLFDSLEAANTRCIVFLDEIDAIGSKRSEESGGGATSARNSTLNVLLRRIEAFQGILIAATNLAGSLDPALWRRFGRQIDVALPTGDERFAILKLYARPFDLGDDALELLTDLTDGAAPSLLRQLVEGLKRLIVIGGKLGVPADDVVAQTRAVIAHARPHPDLPPPPLWADSSLVETLAGTPWPPARLTP